MTGSRDLVGALLAIAAGRAVSGDEIEAACAAVIPKGALAGFRLGDLIWVTEADDAAAWIDWALQKQRGYWPPEFERALSIVAAGYFPHVLSGLVGDKRGRGET